MERRSFSPHLFFAQLANQGTLVLNKLKYFILDECDKMLEQLDMRRDVQEIYLKTPKNKQVCLAVH